MPLFSPDGHTAIEIDLRFPVLVLLFSCFKYCPLRQAQTSFIINEAMLDCVFRSLY